MGSFGGIPVASGTDSDKQTGGGTFGGIPVADASGTAALAGPGRGGGLKQLKDQKREPVQNPAYGGPTLFTGIGNVLTPGHRMEGAGQIVEGASELATPYMLGAAGLGVAGLGSALAAGTLPVRAAGGMAAAFGTYKLTDKAAAAAGIPFFAREILSGIAAAEVGGRLGMSDGMKVKLKSSGLRGILNDLVHGEAKPSQVAEFYRQQHGKLPEPGQETEIAKVEAAAFRKQMAQKLKDAAEAAKPKEPYKSKPLTSLRRSPGAHDPLAESQSRSRSIWNSRTGPAPVESEAEAKAAEAAEAPPAKTKPTTKEKIDNVRKGAPATDKTGATTRDQTHDPWRNAGLDNSDAVAVTKDANIVKLLRSKGITTPEQVLKLSDAELQQYAKEAGHPNGYRGRIVNGKRMNHLSRTPDEGRSDLAKAMQSEK